MLVVGAIGEDSDATGINGNQTDNEGAQSAVRRTCSLAAADLVTAGVRQSREHDGELSCSAIPWR